MSRSRSRTPSRAPGFVARLLLVGLWTPSLAAAQADADSTQRGSLLRDLQRQSRAVFGDELLTGDPDFRDSSVTRFDSLGYRAWDEEQSNVARRWRLSFDPAVPLWAYNRVEGFSFGGGARLRIGAVGGTTLVGQGAYAAGAEDWRWRTAFEHDVDLGRATTATLFATYADRVVPFGSNRPFANGVFSLVGAADEQDYLRRRGGAGGVRFRVRREKDARVQLGVAYEAAKETSVDRSIEFAFFDELHEPNPCVDEGIDRSLVATLHASLLSRRWNLTLEERLSGGALGGDFAYNRFAADLETRFYLGRQEWVTRVGGVHNAGATPVQRLADAGGVSTVRGFGRRTRVGQAAVTMRSEWWVPYDLLGHGKVPLVRRLSLQFVPWADAGRVWDGVPRDASEPWIYSVGLGVQKFLGAMGPLSYFRFDVSLPLGPARTDDVRFHVQFTALQL